MNQNTFTIQTKRILSKVFCMFCGTAIHAFLHAVSEGNSFNLKFFQLQTRYDPEESFRDFRLWRAAMAAAMLK